MHDARGNRLQYKGSAYVRSDDADGAWIARIRGMVQSKRRPQGCPAIEDCGLRIARLRTRHVRVDRLRQCEWQRSGGRMERGGRPVVVFVRRTCVHRGGWPRAAAGMAGHRRRRTSAKHQLAEGQAIRGRCGDSAHRLRPWQRRQVFQEQSGPSAREPHSAWPVFVQLRLRHRFRARRGEFRAANAQEVFDHRQERPYFLRHGAPRRLGRAHDAHAADSVRTDCQGVLRRARGCGVHESGNLHLRAQHGDAPRQRLAARTRQLDRLVF